MSIIEAIIIAIVEGLTEFLPISSTGHMVITSSAFGIGDKDFTKLFEVAIQLGAILAVVILYWKKFFQFTKWQFYVKLLIGVIPALFFGFIFNDLIDEMLGSSAIVAISMVLGGIVLLFIDGWFNQPVVPPPDILATQVTTAELIEADEKLSFKNSFIIGCWQVLAMVPGVSRSAASIIGGMQQKLTRNFAAEFLFLAVPTMFAASAYSLFLKKWGEGDVKKRGYELITETSQNTTTFIIGNIVAFVVALVAIKFFISYLQKHGFKLFGWYRIIVGSILLILVLLGYLK